MGVLRRESQNALEEALALALKQGRFEVDYQPIYSTRAEGPLLAYEALLRAGEDVSPSILLSLARNQNVLGQLEAKVAQRVLTESLSLPPGRLIFINASRDALTNIRWLEAIGRFDRGVVVELQDRNLREPELEMLSRFREHGVGLAFDDLGQTLDDFDTLEQVRPHYIRTDRTLVWEGQLDAIRHLSDVAHAAGTALVVEGVETADQDRIFRPHADLVQGYFYGRPCPIEEVVKHEKERSPAPNAADGGVAALGMQVSELPG